MSNDEVYARVSLNVGHSVFGCEAGNAIRYSVFPVRDSFGADCEAKCMLRFLGFLFLTR